MREGRGFSLTSALSTLFLLNAAEADLVNIWRPSFASLAVDGPKRGPTQKGVGVFQICRRFEVQGTVYFLFLSNE